MRVLWITNDLPPRAGGIQQFIHNLLLRTCPQDTLVLGPAHDAAGEFDPHQPFEVRRVRGAVVPSRPVLRAARSALDAYRPDVVVLGASWPLGELAARLRTRVPVVGLTHGLEAGLCGVGLGVLIRRATAPLAAVTTISDYAEGLLAPHLRAPSVVRVPPGVDLEAFRPGLDASGLRDRWGIPREAPLVGCVSRLVARKGQDTLLEAWPRIRRRHPAAWLVLVGEGPLEERLRARAARLEQVVVTGRIGWDDLPRAYAALDVFAMPCRTRLAGTDVEGLGIVYLEAQACGVPVVAGRSGGAPEAVQDGRTGRVVDGRSVAAVADAVSGFLDDPATAAAAGTAGRAWVEQAWSWDRIADRFRGLLADLAEEAPLTS